MWYNKNRRSLLVQAKVSLEKHEPENADQHWKQTVVEAFVGFTTIFFVMYVILTNV